MFCGQRLKLPCFSQTNSLRPIHYRFKQDTKLFLNLSKFSLDTLITLKKIPNKIGLTINPAHAKTEFRLARTHRNLLQRNLLYAIIRCVSIAKYKINKHAVP